MLLIGLCSVSLGRGQGTFEFTWHGNSNLFQARFSVTATEMQPGGTFNSSLFYNSIAITSPSGLTYHYDNPSDFATGGVDDSGWGFHASLLDFAHGTEVEGYGSEYWNNGFIEEKPISSNDYLWLETGYWTTARTPEPSVAALLAAAVALWVVKRR